MLSSRVLEPKRTTVPSSRQLAKRSSAHAEPTRSRHALLDALSARRRSARQPGLQSAEQPEQVAVIESLVDPLLIMQAPVAVSEQSDRYYDRNGAEHGGRHFAGLPLDRRAHRKPLRTARITASTPAMNSSSLQRAIPWPSSPSTTSLSPGLIPKTLRASFGMTI